jgi:hypothetical protein
MPLNFTSSWMFSNTESLFKDSDILFLTVYPIYFLGILSLHIKLSQFSLTYLRSIHNFCNHQMVTKITSKLSGRLASSELECRLYHYQINLIASLSNSIIVRIWMLRYRNIVFPTFFNSLVTLPLLVLRELGIEALCPNYFGTETTLHNFLCETEMIKYTL